MRLGDGLRDFGVGDRVLLVHHLEEPVGGGSSVERHRQEESDRLDRKTQHRRRREESDQLASGQLPGGGEPDAAQKTQREGDIRNQQQPEPDARDGLRFLDLGSSQIFGLACEILQRVRSATKRLEHSDAVHGFLHRGREVTRLVLATTRDCRVLVLENEPVNPQRD